MSLDSFKKSVDTAKSSDEIEKERKSSLAEVAQKAALDEQDMAELKMEPIKNKVNGDTWGYSIQGNIKGVRLMMTYSNGTGGERSAHIEGKNPVTGVEINQDLPSGTVDRLFNKLSDAIRARDGIDAEASFRAQEMHEKETLGDIFSGTAAENLFVSTDKKAE